MKLVFYTVKYSDRDQNKHVNLSISSQFVVKDPLIFKGLQVVYSLLEEDPRGLGYMLQTLATFKSGQSRPKSRNEISI